jgi:hypothetical protein
MTWVRDHRCVPFQHLVRRHAPDVLAPLTELLEPLHRAIQPLGFHAHRDDLVADPVEQRNIHQCANDEAWRGDGSGKLDRQPPGRRVADHVENVEIYREVA